MSTCDSDKLSVRRIKVHEVGIVRKRFKSAINMIGYYDTVYASCVSVVL